MIKTITKYIAIFTVFAYFLLPKSAFAQAVDYRKIIRITPVILNINLNPGQQQSYDLRLDNLINQPLGIQLSLETLDTTDELTGMVFGNPHANSPFVSWILLSRKQFIIQEKDSQTFSLNVKIPKNAKLGSYTSVIFITPLLSTANQKNSPNVISRIGVLAFANIGTPKEVPTEKLAKILTFNFDQEKNKINAIIRVQNTFNFNLSSKANITLEPILFGKNQIIELEDKRILAGKVRKWIEPVNLSNGIYKADLAVSLGEGRIIYKTIFFSVPSFTYILKYLVILIILLLIFLLRKRLKKAFFILYKG
jgi:hypothetical protein